MKICRFDEAGQSRWGVLQDGLVHALEGDPFGDCRAGTAYKEVSSVRLLAPCEPSKVVCVGRNYRSLLQEQGRDLPEKPFIFLKSGTAVTGPGGEVYYPEGVTDVAHEGELAVVIGRTARRVSEAEAGSVILGYTGANDITVRDWQIAGDQWVRAKSSDTHCPLGPWIETELLDPGNVRVRTLVNGQVRQDGSTDDLVFSIHQLLAYISEFMTLLPGDVVLTGTAAGIRPVQPGDEMTVEVEGIGDLVNPVVPWS